MSGARLEAPRLLEVADRVFAYEQPPGGWCVNNAGILADGDGVVVIDTAATEARARRLRQAVDRLGAGPRRVLVNTHSHGDHTFGNHLFGQAATIIAHENARAEMRATGLALTALWPDTRWGRIAVTPPVLTVSDGLTVHVGDRSARLLPVGPAHTTGDLAVWLPDDRVLFAGDLLMSGCTPFHLFGSISGGLAAIDRLRALNPRTVICGHGPLAGPEVLDRCASYLRWVQRLAASAHAAGLTPLAAAREADLGPFADLLDPERLVGNLHRAYAELDGGEVARPLDAAGIFAEMVAFNGGKLPACLA
ncbi:MBL fold metallo-hydrolase [Pseudofrankia inefficax]